MLSFAGRCDEGSAAVARPVVLAVLLRLEDRLGHPKRPPPPPEMVEAAPVEALELLFSHDGRKAETRCMAVFLKGVPVPPRRLMRGGQGRSFVPLEMVKAETASKSRISGAVEMFGQRSRYRRRANAQKTKVV